MTLSKGGSCTHFSRYITFETPDRSATGTVHPICLKSELAPHSAGIADATAFLEDTHDRGRSSLGFEEAHPEDGALQLQHVMEQILAVSPRDPYYGVVTCMDGYFTRRLQDSELRTAAVEVDGCRGRRRWLRVPWSADPLGLLAYGGCQSLLLVGALG